MRRGLVFLAVALPLVGCATGEDVAETEFTPVETTSSPSVSTTTATAISTTTAAVSTAPDCTNEALWRSGFETDIEMFECEGKFAHAGVPKSEFGWIFQWNGQKWEILPTDGVYEGLGVTGSACYTRAYTERKGVPESLQVHPCEGQNTSRPSSVSSDSGIKLDANGVITTVNWEGSKRSVSTPACDGRNILILESVLEEGSVSETHSKLAFSVFYSGDGYAEFTYPGQCPSLRGAVDGKRVYPVYMDFGSDVAAMCEAKARYGGNGRVLSNAAEYVDPC